MSDLAERLDEALARDEGNVPKALEEFLARNLEDLRFVLDHLRSKIPKFDLRPSCLMKCVLTISESISRRSRTEDEEDIWEQILVRLGHLIYFLIGKPQSPEDVVALCRLMNKIRSTPESRTQKYMTALIRSVPQTSGLNFSDPIVQECGLWCIWFSAQGEQFKSELNTPALDSYTRGWKQISPSVLKRWSAAVRTADNKLACRIVNAIIRLVSTGRGDVFGALAHLEMQSPLKAAVRLLSKRRVEEGFKRAKVDGVADEYLVLLATLSGHLVIVCKDDSKNLLNIATLTIGMLRCSVEANSKCFLNTLLLLRHVIYLRKELSSKELDDFLDLFCSVQEFLPLDNEDHELWKTDTFAKVGQVLPHMIREFKDVSKARIVEDMFMKITFLYMDLMPSSKDVMQLYRTTLALFESALYIEQDSNRQSYRFSPDSAAALLKRLSPENIDPSLLLTCIAHIQQYDVFFCDYLDKNDPLLSKWLSLELYALLRLDKDKAASAYVQSRLKEFTDDENIRVIASVLELRSKAHHGEGLDDVSTNPDEHVLIRSARTMIRFGVKHMQLSKLVATEIKESQKLMFECQKTAHEKWEESERQELSTDRALAYSNLCFGNYQDLFRDLRWTFNNHKHLTHIEYWILLSTFVIDDLRTAAGFFAINGDYANQLRMIAAMMLILTKSRAPKTFIIDTQLRAAEALLLIGCTENARVICDKAADLIKELEFYCEDFYCFESKLERLRLCALIEDNGPNPPENLSSLKTMVRSPTIEKIAVFALARYYDGKAMQQWNLHEAGRSVATDLLDSCSKNMLTLVNHLKMRKSAMTTWERFEVSRLMLLANICRSDLYLRLGLLRDVINGSVDHYYESQEVFSFYFVLQYLEQMTRCALAFEIPIDSKMSIVSDLVDPKRIALPERPVTEQTDQDEAYELHTIDRIPWRAALHLKMKRYNIDTANNRVPAKEFLKFYKRRGHKSECACPVCSSIGIDLTLKQIDATAACETKDDFKPMENSIYERLGSGLKHVLRFCGVDVVPETHCESVVENIRIAHAFSLAQGHASGGDFHKSLMALDNIRELRLNTENALELKLRTFEYTYQIDWRIALSRLGLYTNSPVEVVEPIAFDASLKTPAPKRRLHEESLKRAPEPRRLRIRSEDSDPEASADEEPPKKKETKKNRGDGKTAKKVASAAEPAPRKRKVVQEPQTVDKPSFKPLEDPFERVTRRKKHPPVPRLGCAPTDIESTEDLFEDDGEMSFVDAFSKMNFRDRLKKPKPLDVCNADSEFDALLRAGRECERLSKHSLVADLFQNLAFLCAYRGKKDEFLFYIEQSMGLGPRFAALNRGQRMKDHYRGELVDSAYFNLIKPAIDFEPNWYDRIWEHCRPDWLLVQLATVMEGGTTPGILVTRYEYGHRPEVVYLSASHDVQFQGSLFKHYDRIQHFSKWTLKAKTNDFWRQRYETDSLLSEFRGSLENSWMGCWKGMFLSAAQDWEKEIVDLVREKILRKAEDEDLNVDKRMLDIGLCGLNALNGMQFATMLIKVLGAEKSEKREKIRGLAYETFAYASAKRGEVQTDPVRSPVILVFDKHLINLPFDSCPMFHDIEVTRMPCIALTMAHAFLIRRRANRGNPPFSLENPKNGFYCVNPEDNLEKTQERFLHEMVDVIHHWDGTCGQPLSREDFRKNLQSKSLYLYCGHGTGRQVMRDCVESINVRAVSLLFGCSSARLRRFGTKTDVEGYALRLIIGGAPAVLGNLWDVTDRDIDGFTYSMLRKWLLPLFPKSAVRLETRLGAAVNKTREECKLRALTGAAPVVFGLPCTSYSDGAVARYR
ncbi:uncharacterized protein LOC100898129 [Galendromus occidentalis]|uniref:separase n=1 Tax=Galendromus occidentalis TaxID=34638 RepID=A0AAJ7L588_9ACAR|nr:uncharacterized protein LOC100898129 [Galendromus occidentalis]